MQELEKILEEINQEKLKQWDPSERLETDKIMGWCFDKCTEIIRKHIKNEEDILKFYYCESEDDYYIGQRVQNMYYARYADGGFVWFMSRHLPWREHVVAPETAWKEYTYPSEPKEIPFVKWIEGFIRKHMNDKAADDGWIPVERELPPNAKHKGAFCPKVRVMTKFGETYGWYNPDCESWYILVWFMTERYLDSEIDFERGDKPKIVRLPDEVNDTKHILVAWRPLPEPYRLERS